eukprot:538018-Pelagomonas_calceolata.AAC.1
MAAAIAANSARHMVLRGGVGISLNPGMSACLVPGVLGKRYFLVGAGLRIVVAKVGTSNGNKFKTEMWISSDEFGIG